jgi:hypothetical protein
MSRPPGASGMRTRRLVGGRADLRRVRLVVEGTTEKLYFERWNRALRGVGRFEVVAVEADPLTAVRTIVQIRTQDRRDTRRGTADDADVYGCVVDVDDHATLAEAVELARSEKIAIAVSSPCFELWMILHERDQNGHLSTRDAERLAEQVFARSKPHGGEVMQRMIDATSAALERARHLHDHHERNDGLITSNPRTGVDGLIRAMIPA